MNQLTKDVLYVAVVIFLAIILVKWLFRIGMFLALILVGAYLYYRFARPSDDYER